MLDELASSLSEKKIVFKYTDGAADTLAKKAYSVKFGARNLRRLIQTEVEDKAAELIISSYDSKVEEIDAYEENGEIKVIVRKTAEN